MKHQTNISIFCLLLLFCSSNGFGQHEVAIYGVVSVVDGGFDELSFVVYGDGMQAQKLPISKKGKFFFVLKEGQVAFIRCAKPGYLTKRVKIDTHYAYKTRQHMRTNKAVVFDLEMIPQVYSSEMVFEGPVASLFFNERSGLLKITYNYRMRSAAISRTLLVESRR